MSTSVNNALNSTINTYTYTYQNKLQAKLDKDDNAVWSKDELQNYADSYAKATGTKLDVNGLMEKYANSDGVIDYAGQQQMKADDALGFNNLQALLDKAKATDSTSSSSTSSSSSASTSTTKAMTQSAKDAAIQAVKQYTYDYSGKLQPLLDKNDDGVWSKDELQNYAKLYNKATGNTLDVDKLLEKYGNDNGVIDPTGQVAMKKADALDLAGLQTAYSAATAKTAATVGYVKPYEAYTKDTTIGNRGTKDFSINDLLQTMSGSNKAAFSLRINKYENIGNLLSQMTGGFSATAAFNIATMSTPQSAASQYSLSSQVMNFTA